jgi:hypothetical protein
LHQNQIPGYETWAAAARTTVVNLQATRRVDEMQCMEGATRAAVASLQDRLLTLEEENRSLRESVLEQNSSISEQLRQQNEYLMLILANRDAHPQPVADNQPAAPPPPPEEADDAITAPPADDDDEEDDPEEASATDAAENPPAAPVAEAPAVLPQPRRHRTRNQQPAHVARPARAEATAADLAWREARAANAPAHLRRTTRMPNIPKRCPPRWQTHYNEWYSKRYCQFRSGSRDGWTRTVLMAFNKRLSIFKEIERAAEELMTTQSRAAAYLDANRRELDLNFTAHLEHRKQGNPGHERRSAFPQAYRPRPATQQPAPQPRPAPTRPPPRQQQTIAGVPYQPTARAIAMMNAGMQDRLRRASNLTLARRRALYTNDRQALDEDEVAFARNLP